MNRMMCVVLLLSVSAIGFGQTEVGGVESQMLALDVELKDRPASGVTDIYKFLYQGQFGPGHAIDDRDSAARFLSQEIADQGDLPVTESLCQPLGGSPAMVRIHLRPFIASGYDPDGLVAAFAASAEEGAGTADAMDRVMEKAVARLTRRSRWDLAGQLEDLRARLAAESYPAVHHSDKYKAAYHPAYRVITLELGQQHGWCE